MTKRYAQKMITIARRELAARRRAKELEEKIAQLEGPRFRGRWIESVETEPSNELDVVERVVRAFRAAKHRQADVPEAYQPGGSWEATLVNEWGHYQDALRRDDIREMAGYLRNFFRNEGISGLWGGGDVYDTFCRADRLAQLNRAHIMLDHYRVWRECCPLAAPEELDAPRVGNPWGFRFGDLLLYEPVFEYTYQAHYLDSLLGEMNAPVVMEIGGGFGGLAYHLLRCRPSVTYVGLDIPEYLLIQSYYLSCTFPDRKILVYHQDAPAIDTSTLEDYDVLLLPNYVLPELPSRMADLVVSVHSLTEMSADAIGETLRQIDRIGRQYFFHESIYKRRPHGRRGIPSSEFPPLRHFRQVMACPTRWPRYDGQSSYPCWEHLLVHRQAMSGPRGGGIERARAL
jgi:putative sugar O-methyltransferase